MIEFNEFSFRYREGAEPVVRDITLSIPDGCFVGITGAAGSGKSTLTYAINGIIPHCYPGDFYGSVTVEGCDTVDTSLTDLSRLVGSVCQDIDSQMVSTVVEDEILYGLENFAVPREEIPARVDEALASMGIADLRDRTIDSLSGGQKQKVAVASVLAPPTIILDEPTTGLDFRECVKVMDVVRELNENGTTVIMVCHDMEVVGDFARRVIAMTAGRVVADGPTFEVLRDGRVLKEAHILPPQVTEVSLILGREAACPAAVAEANTVAQMVTAVAQACDREVEDVEVEAID